MENYQSPFGERVLAPSIPILERNQKNKTPQEDALAALDAAKKLLETEKSLYAKVDEIFSILTSNFPRHSSVGLCKPSGAPLNVLSGATVLVQTLTIDEAYEAYLKFIGVDCNPINSMQNLAWTLKINSVSHPKFNAQVFNASTIATPLAFHLYLNPKSVVDLYVTNNDTIAVDVSAILDGWMTPVGR